jgi:seryl-tRNA synthetase
MPEMPKNSKVYFKKMTSGLKENSNKQLDEVKKSIQNLDEEEIQQGNRDSQNKHTKVLEIKSSINQKYSGNYQQ